MRGCALSRARRAFTLVELMIVVAIIGILAAAAVPNYVRLQYRSKRSELDLNIQAIKHVELTYEAAHDRWVGQDEYWPDDAPNKALRSWPAGSNFDLLGWAPDGEIRGSYRVLTSESDFEVQGLADIDGDGERSSWIATKESNVQRISGNDTY